MSVFKEFYRFLDKVAVESYEIIPGKYGAPIRKGDDIWNELAHMKDMYFNPTDDFRAVYPDGVVKMEIAVMNESDGSMAEEVWLFTYVKNPTLMHDGILSVERLSRIERYPRWDD